MMNASTATVPAKIVMKRTSTMSLHERFSRVSREVDDDVVETKPSVTHRDRTQMKTPTQHVGGIPVGGLRSQHMAPQHQHINSASRTLRENMDFRPNPNIMAALEYERIYQERSVMQRLGARSRLGFRGYHGHGYAGFDEGGGWGGGYRGRSRGSEWRQDNYGRGGVRGQWRFRNNYIDRRRPFGKRGFRFRYGRGWGGRRGGRGRGGFRGGFMRQNRSVMKISKDDLDSQLDEYMSKTKATLDSALDGYMAELAS